MKEFVGLRAKIYSYLKDSNDYNKKAKVTKKDLKKGKLKIEDRSRSNWKWNKSSRKK